MKEQDFPGTFIVIEGTDGAGTTTQSENLAEKLDAHWTSEPTSGKIGKKIEEMISSDKHSPESIALAFAADRMNHLEQEVIPKLKDGKTVVCDRYYHSSLTYQPALGAEYSWVLELNRDAIKPDVTIVLDISSEEALSRVEKREHNKFSGREEVESRDQSHLGKFLVQGSDDNIFENLSFQQEVVARYRRLPERLDENIEVVDSSGSIEEVFENVEEAASKVTGDS